MPNEGQQVQEDAARAEWTQAVGDLDCAHDQLEAVLKLLQDTDEVLEEDSPVQRFVTGAIDTLEAMRAMFREGYEAANNFLDRQMNLRALKADADGDDDAVDEIENLGALLHTINSEPILDDDDSDEDGIESNDSDPT